MRLPWQKRGTLNDRTVPLSSSNIIQFLGLGGGSMAGVDVTESSSLQSMAVWRAVKLTSGTVASLPLKVYRDKPEGREEVSSMLFRDPAYPDMSWFEFIETTVLHILLWGNAYSLKVRNEAGTEVVRVLPIAPDRVRVKRLEPTEFNPSGKRFEVVGIDEVFTPYDIMHIPAMSTDGLVGLSPIAQARNAIGIGLAAEQVAAKLYDSGLINGGILQAQGDITDEQAEAVKRRWTERMSGANKHHEIAILSAGFTFTPATIPPKDAQWLEARQFSVEEIARLFDVPADLLFENSATGNTDPEARAITWVKFGLNPLLSRIESRFSMHLLPRGQFAEFNTDGLLRGDTLTQAQVFASAIEKGWLTVDEVRAIKNLPPLPKQELEPPELELPVNPGTEGTENEPGES